MSSMQFSMMEAKFLLSLKFCIAYSLPKGLKGKDLLYVEKKNKLHLSGRWGIFADVDIQKLGSVSFGGEGGGGGRREGDVKEEFGEGGREG